MTEKEIKLAKEEIDNMSHFELAKFYNDCTSDHPWFIEEEVWFYFYRRFSAEGGITKDIFYALMQEKE